MKKIISIAIFVILASCLFVNQTFILAVTPSIFPSETPNVATNSAKPTIEKDVEVFKEKIATKVAELVKEEKKAFAGRIISFKDNFIEIKKDENTTYSIKIDTTLTKIYQITGQGKKEITLDDLNKDDYIIVTGPLIDKTVNANYIYVDEQFTVLAGKIIETNTEDYSIKVSTLAKEDYILDIETSTKMNMINVKTLEIEKTGFSKLKNNDRVVFVIKKGAKKEEKNRFSASKILVIPQEYFLK
ncbi:MAG: hypothetical protein QHH09_02880 [Microgenomates group bacterium]|nr:hypothetical protein [Microgenomates group bacterium]